MNPFMQSANGCFEHHQTNQGAGKVFRKGMTKENAREQNAEREIRHDTVLGRAGFKIMCCVQPRGRERLQGWIGKWNNQ